MAVEKHIKLSDEAGQVVTRVQNERDLSWNKALEYLVMDYDRNCNVA